jgi:RND family efflux transporter MFP subunit
LKKFAGPEHFTLKTVFAAILLVLLFLVFAKGVHRVRAHTTLEGVVQRGISAPFNGYVVEAPARPGDRVRQGDLLCRLDDREMKLERLKWATQREQFAREDSEALAKHDRAEALINEAKEDQADAQVSLLDEQLSRTRVVAPFDGIVTSGDFSQSLGMPVERGQVLFEVAPLQGYRVIVEVDERDIGRLAVGQRGELALPSVPGTILPLVVTRITPVSTAKEGRNYFRVEARLQKTSESLRPGMEGSGKISVGRARLVWIWSHAVLEWIRLKAWSWFP